MKLSVWTVVYSLTQIEGMVWRQDDYNASTMKKLIKRQTLSPKGYLQVKIGQKWERFDNKNGDEFVSLAAKIVARKIPQLVSPGVALVPVPNSNAIIGVKDYNTLDFSRRISASCSETIPTIDALRWKQARQSSHTGGSRDPDVLADNLTVINKPTIGNVVLIDDVLTKGAHMAASARVLQEYGVNVLAGVAFIKATWTQREKITGWDYEEIEVSRSTDIEFDSF